MADYTYDKNEQAIVTHNTAESHKQNRKKIHTKYILNHANYIKFKKRENYSVALAIKTVVTSEKGGRF